jgi:hypothetical protein
MSRHSDLTIVGDQFFLNGKPTYEGVRWRGHRIEGLMFNSRMVQAIFDDLNPETRSRWSYRDTGVWDAERNTTEFLAAMPLWRQHGLLAVTINLQGGSPQGYSSDQPWHNSAISGDGTLRSDYMRRLERILDRADDLAMVVILGIFYFGQESRLQDERAVVRAVDSTVDWLLDRGYRNVLIEIANESGRGYRLPILGPARVHELILRVKGRHRGRRLLASTSCGGDSPELLLPNPHVVRAADFVLLHGNNVAEPEQLRELVRKTRQVDGYRPMPVLFNEDDHVGFENPLNHLIVAVEEYTSWGYFDYRRPGEGFEEGYQSPPIDWGIGSARKRGFFGAVATLTKGA